MMIARNTHDKSGQIWRYFEPLLGITYSLYLERLARVKDNTISPLNNWKNGIALNQMGNISKRDF